MSKISPRPNTRSILRTGCSSGIGKACALSLHSKGFQVFASARKFEDVEALRELGLECVQLDLDNTDSIKLAVKQVLSKTGGTLYALFNNAGFAQPGAVEDLSRDTIRAQFETNVFGTIELTNQIIPIMRKQRFGRIVQNSSMLGFICMQFRGAYNASKHALEGFTDTLRLELKQSNIKVSTIEPGPIVSKFRENAYKKFLENIDRDSSHFKEVYEKVALRLNNQTKEPPFTLDPIAVEKKLIHAITSKHPKAKYYVTIPTYFFGYLKRALPTSTLDKILQKVGEQEINVDTGS